MNLKTISILVFQGVLIGVVAFLTFIAFVSIKHDSVEADYYYKHRIRVEKLTLETLKFSVGMFSYQKGKLPTSLAELVPEYLPKLPHDSWEKEYIYTTKNERFKIKTLGQDGMIGGKGHDFDFSTSTIWAEHLK